MKKKLMAALMAAAVMMFGSITALAESATASEVEAPVAGQTASTSVVQSKEAVAANVQKYASETSASAGYSVSALPTDVAQAAVVQVQNKILNDLATTGLRLGNEALINAAKDSGKVTAEILTAVEVSTSGASKDANGNYVVTLNVSGVASGDTIAVLHYDASAEIWETILPTSTGNGSVTFATKSLSPIAIVKISAAGLVSSPKTGESVPNFAGIIVIAAIGAAALCKKKLLA